MRKIEVLKSMVGNGNILDYHDCQLNEKKDGVGWDDVILMEYIKPLKKHLKEHEMTQQDVVRMGIDICRALEVCSKKSLIHSNIKDDNIFVNDDSDANPIKDMNPNIDNSLCSVGKETIINGDVHNEFSTIKENNHSGNSISIQGESTYRSSSVESPSNVKTITPTKMRGRVWSLVIWSILLLLIWIAYRIFVPSIHPTISSQIKVGDYLNFGKYYGESILWKCVEKNNEEMTLISEYILCQKAYDAAESGAHDQGRDDVQKYGSNVWSNSNIREWLNSAEQSVTFTTQAPTKSAVWNGLNAYADEPGFLSNFTQAERDAIAAVTHDGVTDKVFLPSEEEVNQYYGNSDSLRKRQITAIGKQNGELNYDADGNYWFYWTRSPGPGSSFRVRSVRNYGAFGSSRGLGAYVSHVGIAPALHISLYLPIKGTGTIEDPWSY